jgi:hypothetical protein
MVILDKKVLVLNRFSLFGKLIFIEKQDENSVFSFSDRPEIYSNGYQICFDAHNGSIGYILPNWIEDEYKDNEYLNWTTRICLPLKSENEMQKHKSRSLTESFNDIHPSLLLFLNRLRSIAIDNRLTYSKQIYERIDIPGTSIVEIHGGQMIEKWFIIKKQLVIPEEIKASLDDVIEATEIALAFPLHEIKSNGEIVLTKQDVYAYLPLRTVNKLSNTAIITKLISFSSLVLHSSFKLILK